LVRELRQQGLRAELYMGDSTMKAQLRYADARGARFVVIEGEDERAAGEVTIKDLQLGKEKSAEIDDNAEWRASEHAQQQVSRDDLASRLKELTS
ncbi:MAG: histidine--tRNA ligase, partial [Rhodobiaceae bacterium]|nr:histidine--tRNA ligase [Rhodobiaceae bacterium]